MGGNLFIGGAPLLTSLAELSNINTINGELKIQSLSLLTNLSGLDNINPATIQDLTIRYNHTLSMCAVQSICAYLADPGGEVDIAANITGCNSEEEVIDDCESIGIDAPDPVSSFAIYPNPASGSIQVETPVNGTLVISNFSGRKLLSKEISKPVATVDITIMPAGVYIVKVVSEKDVMVGKVVKQ